MASTTSAVLHHYRFRDQSTAHASHRKSMYIGTIANGEQELWISFDKRGESVHPRYWDKAGGSVSSVALKGDIHYVKGLELSNFKAAKKTKAHKPQREKQKLLIRRIYHQGGVQYEGDVAAIEAIQADKDEKQVSRRKIAKVKSGKMKNTTPKKTKIKQDPKLILQQFQTNACSLSRTPSSVKKLQMIMRKHLPDEPTPSTRTLHAALEEAHADGENDATKTMPYATWRLNREQYANISDANLSGYGDDEEDVDNDEDSDGDNEDDEDDEEETGHEDEDDRMQGLEEVEQEEDENDEGDEEDNRHEDEDDRVEKQQDDSGDGNAGVGLHSTSGPSDRVPSPTASGVSTQWNQLLQGSSGNGTPNVTNKWAELIFRNYKRRA